jgi:hypothetical protein
MANRGDSEALFRILMADVGHWTAARKGQRPGLVMVDEWSAIRVPRNRASISWSGAEAAAPRWSSAASPTDPWEMRTPATGW